jgi:hypothetical protein
MPISIIGPMKMRKFARKRNTTKITCTQSDGVERMWLIAWRMLPAAPSQVAFGLFLAERISQTIVIRPVK